MTGLDTTEVRVHDERVTIPVPVASPVARGSVDVCLSTARGGPPGHGTLARTLVVADGVVPPLTLFARDIRSVWPRGGRAWLVVRYAGQVLATGEVRLLVG